MGIYERYRSHPYYELAVSLAEIWMRGWTASNVRGLLNALPQEKHEVRRFFFDVSRDLEQLELQLYPFITGEEFAIFLIEEADSDRDRTSPQKAQQRIAKLTANDVQHLTSANPAHQELARRRIEARTAAEQMARDRGDAIRKDRERAYAEQERKIAARARKRAEMADRLRALRAKEEAELAKFMAEIDAYSAKAQEEFEALGERMRVAASREELVALGRQRAKLAPLTGRTYVYQNHCWDCKGDISSEIHARCPTCRWYICGCGACGCKYPGNMGLEDE